MGLLDYGMKGCVIKKNRIFAFLNLTRYIMSKPDYLFETSWEICNKVGGIYTVLSTKAFTAVNHFQNNYICIGPDLSREDDRRQEFIEDPTLFKNWRENALSEGLRIRIGRWNVSGNPIVVLVDFTPYFEKKNDILTQFWLSYKLDSISGQWDYIEPALFGYAAGRVVESFYQFYCTSKDKIVAQFHEWMTGTGILYLHQKAPQVATVFTTHATVLGRCIAGNLLPLYGNIRQYHPQDSANRFGVQSKFSLEYLSAQTADAFSTVSDITNIECQAFLGKAVDSVTINGFENNFVPKGEEYQRLRTAARQKLLHVASALTQQDISDDALLLINSGRYEFHNKGIDMFIKGLAKLNQNEHLQREVVAFIAVPAGTSGKRTDLMLKMQQAIGNKPVTDDFTTHPLYDSYNDPVIKSLLLHQLHNAAEQKVKVVFIPVYLNGEDGIFDMTYYELLPGIDLSVFPSYYEPWGYTPLESVAFGIPTITTTNAGFGQWAAKNFGQQNAVTVITRTDDNDEQVAAGIADAILYHAACKQDEYEANRQQAREISQQALWNNLYTNYLECYAVALSKSMTREDLYRNKTSKVGLLVEKIHKPEPVWHRISVKSKLPEQLKKLEKLSQNLWWSWNYEARELFEEAAGKERWMQYEENPVYMLQELPYSCIEKLMNDKEYLAKLDRVYAYFEQYMNENRSRKEEQVAYFSMEFGISNELKIFSGGLGMLAGDYLKEASDCNVNMVGIGLLYRYGYFTQQISAIGDQINLYPPQSFSKLPIHPYKDEEGKWITISLALPGRNLYARIWRVDVGRVPLLLLDTDFNDNTEEDRKTTNALYGGDIENRLKQEILLGIGGIRVLEKLEIHPTVYHLNEGHAAFLNLERLRSFMQEKQIPFGTAIELVRSSSLFTTHTPVPAGHDTFSEDLMRRYFSFYSERCNIDWPTFMSLGRKNMDDVYSKFSMSILACKLSQEINGVSAIHGRVSREMFNYLYEGHLTEELHIGHVTNGVHYPSWAHKKWQKFHHQLFDNQFIHNQSDAQIWKKIYDVEDADIWKIKDSLRGELIDNIKELLEVQMRRRNESPDLIVHTLKSIRKDVLTIGFARRFATYKRAHLLFTNEEKLRRLLNNPAQPVQFVFAGKAHPHDKAGQDLIKRILEFSRKPDFIGKIIILENYDIILAKKLISGCDVWLNTPTRPLEASGTSGEKAVMNGVLNFSVLDGWWAEGYKEGAGWAINEQITYTDNGLQDQLDATTIYTMIEDQIAPCFYRRDEKNVPCDWVKMMKNCFYMISPHFTMKRQLDDYYDKFYHKLEKQHKLLSNNNLENTFKLVKWKEKVITAWDGLEVLELTQSEPKESTFTLGDKIVTNLCLKLGTLRAEDIKVELVCTKFDHDRRVFYKKLPFKCIEDQQGKACFSCTIEPKDAGMMDYSIRIIPANPLLPHDMDFNLVKWL